MKATPRRLVLAIAGSCLLLSAAVTLGAGSAATASSGEGRHTEPLSTGTPGYCTDDKGVTVVVDFNELGGGIVVRCAPGPLGSGFTGLDALNAAGFRPQGTQRWGLSFICRLAGKPTSGQELPIQGDQHYKEACVDTPPPQAFWGYWYAPNGGTWTYSDSGPTYRDAIAGGFEGWSFSLNHEGDSPPPSIAPKRPQQPPPTTPPPSHQPPTHSPPSHQPPTHSPPSHQPPTHQPSTHGPTTHQPATHQPASQQQAAPPGTPAGTATTSQVPTAPVTTSTTHGQSSHPASSSQESSSGPTDNAVAVGSNGHGEKVSGALPSDTTSHSSNQLGALLGMAVIVLLGVGGGLTAWRRRAHR